MKKNKKLLGAAFLTIILILLLFIRVSILFFPAENDQEDLDDIIIASDQSHSIYNGTDPQTIAERFAEAIGEGPIKSKEIKKCCGGDKIYKYELQNNNHFKIEIHIAENNTNIIEDMFLFKSNYHEGNQSFDAEYAKNTVLVYVKNFLAQFGVELGDDYEVIVKPWHQNSSWKVDIYQLYNGERLDWSGFHATVDRENGEIRTIYIDEWLDLNNNSIDTLSIDEGRRIIYKEIEENGFNFKIIYTKEHYDEELDYNVGISWEENKCIPINLSDIKFVGNTSCWGRLGYTYEINLQVNETYECIHRYILNAEDGKKLYWRVQSDNSGRIKYYYNNLI